MIRRAAERPSGPRKRERPQRREQWRERSLRPRGRERARELAARMPLTRDVVDRFVAGPSPSDALAAAALVADAGALATIDRLGEVSTDPESAGRATASYLTLLDLADRAGIADDLDVSVRLSAIGQAVPRDGTKVAHDNAVEICARACDLGATVTVEAADHATMDATLSTLTELRRDVPTTGASLRADLRRTPGDCQDLAVAGSRVRLGRGTRPLPSSMAHQTRSDIRIAYAGCLGILMAGAGYPMVATHDPELIALAARLAIRFGRPRDSYEYQFLFGARRREQRRLAEAGYRTRVYIPYGPLWPGHLRRLLTEKPSDLRWAVRSFGHWG